MAIPPNWNLPDGVTVDDINHPEPEEDHNDDFEEPPTNEYES